MNVQTLVKTAGCGLMVSGLALGYSYVSHPHHMTPETIASRSWMVIHVLFAVSVLFGLLATTALYAVTFTRSGGSGLIGYVAVFFGMSLIFGLDYYEFLIAPYLAVHYPRVITDHGAGDAMGWMSLVFPLSGLLTMVGYVLLGWSWMKIAILPKAIAVSLMVTAIAFGIGLSPAGGIVAAQATAALFGAALIATGFYGFAASGRFVGSDRAL